MILKKKILKLIITKVDILLAIYDFIILAIRKKNLANIAKRFKDVKVKKIIAKV